MGKVGKLTIEGRVFEHVKTRDYTPVSIFKSDEIFLRIGPKELLEEEINFHRTLIKFGFPVPNILSEGNLKNEHYYMESSLGDKSFSDLFSEDLKNRGEISKIHFEEFVKLTKKFTKAQLTTKETERDEESFYFGVNVDHIIKELPELKGDVFIAFKKAMKKTDKLPFVLTHGDLNPRNILEKGVIDFGNSFHAPAGYDLVTNIYNAYNFPKDDGYEMKRSFDFSNREIQLYFNEMSIIYTKLGLPALTDFIDDFIFCRTIWSVVRMQKTPKIQKWRYDRFRKILQGYLDGQSLVEMVVI